MKKQMNFIKTFKGKNLRKYKINKLWHRNCFLRFLPTRCCVRKLSRSLRSLVRFVIRQQLVRKYPTRALSMK